MNLVRYEHPQLALASQLERLFGPLFKDFGRGESSLMARSEVSGETATLQCDFYESQDGYLLSLPLPGITKDRVELEISNAVLTVKIKLMEEEDESEGIAAESRSFSVPNGVNIEEISAKMENGVLLLSLPKKKEAEPLSIDFE